MASLTFRVDGVPVAQGSVQAFVVKGRALVVQGGSSARRASLGAWRQAVAARATEAGAVPIIGPVGVELLFVLTRPPSRRKRDRWPDRRPDVDKLVRSVLDALTGICWNDDAQVVSLQADKAYADATIKPGLRATVWAIV